MCLSIHPSVCLSTPPTTRWSVCLLRSRRRTFLFLNDLDCNIIDARIRSVREGNAFSLFVCPPGGYPPPDPFLVLFRGYPFPCPGPVWGVPFPPWVISRGYLLLLSRYCLGLPPPPWVLSRGYPSSCYDPVWGYPQTKLGFEIFICNTTGTMPLTVTQEDFLVGHMHSY